MHDIEDQLDRSVRNEEVLQRFKQQNNKKKEG